MGWTLARLAELVAPSSEKIEPQAAGALPYIGLEHIEAHEHQVLSNGVAADVRSTKNVFRCDDVLYGKLRPYLNKSWVATFDGICSTDIIVFSRSNHLEPRYLLHLLSRSTAVEFANHHSAGVQLPRISFNSLGELECPFPPLAEQKRIVERVEALLAQVRSARGRLERVQQILKRFRQAVLAAACEGQLTRAGDGTEVVSLVAEPVPMGQCYPRKVRRGVPREVVAPPEILDVVVPEGWEKVSVAELLRRGWLIDVKDGNHGANHPKAAEFTSSGLPFITAANVREFDIDYSGAPKVSGPALSKLRVGFAQPGDAILTHKGSVGRSALCRQECVLTPQTTYYRADESALIAEFLVYQFASPLFYRQLAAVMSQTTRDFVPISEQYRLFLVVPPRLEQAEIVLRVKALLSRSMAVAALAMESTRKAAVVPHAILAKAFAGELVPTEAELARAEGREFESGEELLARVRAGTGAPDPSVRRKGPGRRRAKVAERRRRR